MGSGKSSVARGVAHALGRELIDADDWVEKEQGMQVAEIFERLGEAGFREIEERAVEKLCLQSGIVLSMGGGVVERECNRQRLWQAGKVFYLHASPKTLWSRLQGDETRPLLKTGDPLKVLDELLKKRLSWYSQAHETIETDMMTVDEVVTEALKRLRSQRHGDTLPFFKPA